MIVVSRNSSSKGTFFLDCELQHDLYGPTVGGKFCGFRGEKAVSIRLCKWSFPLFPPEDSRCCYFDPRSRSPLRALDNSSRGGWASGNEPRGPTRATTASFHRALKDRNHSQGCRGIECFSGMCTLDSSTRTAPAGRNSCAPSGTSWQRSIKVAGVTLLLS